MMGIAWVQRGHSDGHSEAFRGAMPTLGTVGIGFPRDLENVSNLLICIEEGCVCGHTLRKNQKVTKTCAHCAHRATDGTRELVPMPGKFFGWGVGGRGYVFALCGLWLGWLA